jgi:hypothetical protein
MNYRANSECLTTTVPRATEREVTGAREAIPTTLTSHVAALERTIFGAQYRERLVHVAGSHEGQAGDQLAARMSDAVHAEVSPDDMRHRHVSRGEVLGRIVQPAVEREARVPTHLTPPSTARSRDGSPGMSRTKPRLRNSAESPRSAASRLT